MNSNTSAQSSQASVLIVAYGNLSRRDDGVAFHIVRRLREWLGLPAPESAPGEAVDDDYAEWNDGLAVACMHQLAPEMVDMLAERDTVVFVDAHVADAGWASVEWREVAPAYHSGMVSHHLKPDAVLALCRSLYGRCPRGYVLSVVGVDFDFGETLSPTTSALLDEALGHLTGLLGFAST
jgi:hydrogenase maturation protease